MKPLIEMLRHHEGVRYAPYRCPALLWTVGVGHVIDPAHLRVPLDQRSSLPIPAGWDRKLTDAEVDNILEQDLARFLDGVRRLCPVGLTDNRYWALTSFAFNVGLGNLQASTLRQKHNREEFDAAANEFLRWNRAAGQELKGLTIRRQDERALYCSR